jgi:hypothetical protein
VSRTVRGHGAGDRRVTPERSRRADPASLTAMARARPVAQKRIVTIPAKLAACLLEHGVDLSDPAMAAAFASGVSAAEEAIRGEERRLKERCRG